MPKKLNPKWAASRESHRKARIRLKKEGLCLWRCGTKAVEGKILCKGCAKLSVERAQAYRKKIRKKLKEKQARLR